MLQMIAGGCLDMWRSILSWLERFTLHPLANCKACGSSACQDVMFRVRGIGFFCSPAEFNAWTSRNW